MRNEYNFSESRQVGRMSALQKEGGMLDQRYTAVIKHDGGWWIGWIEEIPGVNCQERSKEKLLETLTVTLREALELNRTEAINAAGEGYEETPITL